MRTSLAADLRAGWPSLIAWIVACLAVGWIGAAGTETGQSPWYQALQKPSWNPPNWVFAPVWSALYVLMGVAAWLVSRRHANAGATWALTLFVLQLAANFAWTFIVFGAHRIGLALVDIVALWILIVATIVAFRRVDLRAALLLVPYLCWVTFASALNFSIWRSN